VRRGTLVGRPLFTLGGHLGPSVSALVDGQLAPTEEERAWAHVMSCAGCRRLVEAEGAVKTRLATLRGEPAPPRLLGARYDIDAWAAADAVARTGQRRRGLVAWGAGSVGAAVLGISALAGAPVGGTPAPPAPVTSIKGSAGGAGPSAPAPSVLSPALPRRR